MGFWEERANLSGKRALVAGGGGGLGRACALDLARTGVRLALCDRDAAALQATSDEIAAIGGHPVLAVIDARDPEALGEFFGVADAAFGGELDILVNVVGGTFFQPFSESTARGWDALIRTNYTWLLTSIHLAIPRMRRAGAGSIINITSSDAHRGVPNVAVYTSLKAAVTHLGRSLAIELGADHIRVNTIAPVDVPTEGMAPLGTQAPDLSASGVAHSRLGRRGTLEDIGNCAVFLASDLSSYITASTLHPSGGVLA